MVQSFDIPRTVSVYPDQAGIRWWTKAWFNNRKDGEASVEISRQNAIQFIRDEVEKDEWLEKHFPKQMEVYHNTYSRRGNSSCSNRSTYKETMTDSEQFNTRIVPIMDRVREDLQRRQAEEVRRFMRSPAYILSGISGPDGGMASQAVALDSLKVTGEWNSKTTEDYVEMVKAELVKEGIAITPELEETMIDKMARDQVPQSSIDYILRKAASNSIFGLPEEARKTPLQREIEERAEEMYNPSKVEKGIGWGLGAAADFTTMGGLGGGVVSGLKFVGADLAINAVIDTVDAIQRKDVPKVIAPGHEEEWLAMNRGKQEETEPQKQEPSIQEQSPVEQVEPEPQAV